MAIGHDLLLKVIGERRTVEFGRLRRDWFESDEVTLYDEIANYLTEYGALPVRENIATTTFTDLGNTPYQYLVDEVYKRKVKNSLSDLSGSLDVSNDPTGTLDTLREFVHRFDMVNAPSRDVYTMEDLHNMTVEFIRENRHKVGMIGIPSGWPSLDRVTGGFQPGNVYGFFARPKLGKSIALSFMADASYKAGFIDMLISMEMVALEQARRTVALQANVSMKAVQSAQVCNFTEAKILEVTGANRARYTQPFYLVEGQLRKNFTQIASIVHGLQPHIVYLDGGYLVRKEGIGRMAKWEIMTEIIESLKTLSVSAHVPIVVSFQFNRAGGEKAKSKEGPDKVGLEHAQLSDAIAQIVSVGVGIFEDKTDKSRRCMKILGGRQGEEGSWFIHWDWKRMNFTEIEVDDVAPWIEEEVSDEQEPDNEVA